MAQAHPPKNGIRPGRAAVGAGFGTLLDPRPLWVALLLAGCSSEPAPSVAPSPMTPEQLRAGVAVPTLSPEAQAHLSPAARQRLKRLQAESESPGKRGTVRPRPGTARRDSDEHRQGG